jgi:hypothetical protein
MLLRTLVIALVVACGGGKSKPPAYVSDVDQVLAVKPGPRDVAAPTSLESRPWKVGQWALYRMRTGDVVGYMRYRAVAQDTCGLWFEQTIADRSTKLVIKLCLPSPPDLTTAAQATMQVNDGAAQPLNPPPKNVVLAGAGWSQQADAPREELTVPAGRFAGTVKTTSMLKGVATTVWSHPAVPLAGTVKAHAANGVTTELVDFGDS